MQKAECKTFALRGPSGPAFGHSAFFILPSAFKWRSGGGLMLIAQSSDIQQLTKLAVWLEVRLSARGIDGGGTANAWRVPDVDRVTTRY
jgi:hypothetical protein